MVHSEGTRSESQRFRMDRTGSRKYSGRSGEFRCVSATGELAARRAMPTSFAADPRVRSSKRGTPWLIGSGGGQSAVGQPGLLSRGPVAAGAKSPLVQCLGLSPSEPEGKSVGCGTARRRKATGDMAHLTAPGVFRFLFAMSRQLFRFCFATSHIRRRAKPRAFQAVHGVRRGSDGRGGLNKPDSHLYDPLARGILTPGGWSRTWA